MMPPFSKMVLRKLFFDHPIVKLFRLLGQEDEAWFQGNIVGKTTMQFMQDEYTLYDVTLVLEDDLPAILIRIATKNDLYKNFNIGEYIRGNLWIQANIYAKTGIK